MKAKILIRIAAGLILFFALGHTMGHIGRHDVKEPEAKEALKIMSETKFDQFGTMRSFDENYTGMSLNLIFTLLTFTIILWFFSAYTEKYPDFVKKVLIPIALCVTGFSVTGFLYFFMVPAITCLLAAFALFVAFFKLKA